MMIQNSEILRKDSNIIGKNCSLSIKDIVIGECDLPSYSCKDNNGCGCNTKCSCDCNQNARCSPFMG